MKHNDNRETKRKVQEVIREREKNKRTEEVHIPVSKNVRNVVAESKSNARLDNKSHTTIHKNKHKTQWKGALHRMTQQKLTRREYRDEITRRTYMNLAHTEFNKTTGKWETTPMAHIYPKRIGEGKPEIITVKEFNERYAMILILFGAL